MLPGIRCSACGLVSSPPRDSCPRCGATDLASVELDGGQVVASTWVPSKYGKDGFGADGFGVAWVDLDDGPRVQVFVAASAPPAGVRGVVNLLPIDGAELPVFEPESL